MPVPLIQMTFNSLYNMFTRIFNSLRYPQTVVLLIKTYRNITPIFFLKLALFASKFLSFCLKFLIMFHAFTHLHYCLQKTRNSHDKRWPGILNKLFCLFCYSVNSRWNSLVYNFNNKTYNGKPGTIGWIVKKSRNGKAYCEVKSHHLI